MNKTVFVLAMILLLKVLTSCCECLESSIFRYTFNSIETVHINNAGEKPIFVNDGTISKEAYGLLIRLSLSQIAAGSRLSGFSSANAMRCDCPPEMQYIAQDSLAGIRIFTLNDFDAAHLSDSDISDFFSVNYASISDYLENPAKVYYDPVAQDSIIMYLMYAPEFSGEHQFKVEIAISDGSTLSAVSSPIILE
ncbi:MAG: hypothetical protein FD155_1838 [Bacteroidetes bacterium]|nr:MAG: hypothetical protein FD155_1838 [Bacteroidota bacterium]